MARVMPIIFKLQSPFRPKPFAPLIADAPAAAQAGATRLWLPSDLGSKLKTWLKGDDLSGSNGSSITTWTDASGNANNATGGTNKPTLVTAGLNGLNTAAFAAASSQNFSLPTGLLSGRTQSAGFAVFKLTTSPPAGTATAGPVFGDFGTDSSANHNPWQDGNFYEDYCTDTRRTVTGVPASTSFRILGLRSKSNDWRLDVNGTNYFTDATNTVAVTSAPLIGTSTGATTYLDGQIAEIVDCNDFLLTGEKEQVEGYLAWKWGLQASLPGGHTYAAAAPTVTTSDTTAALSGQSLAVAQGSVLATTTVALTGQSLSVAQGTVVGGSVVTGQSTTIAQGSTAPTTSVALTGQSLTAARGTLTPGIADALSGQGLTATQGTPTPGISEALTGQSAVVSRGTIIPANILALTGLPVVVSRGSVTAGSDATAALTGQSLGAAIGSVSPTVSFALSGQTLAAARGTVSVLSSDVTAALTGLSLSTTQGSITSSTALALTGLSARVGHGSITGDSPVVVVLPTMTFGFHRQLPTQTTWGPGSSSGAAWTDDNKTQSNWTAGGDSTGANWEKS